MLLSVLGASWLHFDLELPREALRDIAVIAVALPAAKTACFELFRLPRTVWRHFGLPDVWSFTAANASGSLLAALTLATTGRPPVPLALLSIDWLLSQVLLLGIVSVVRTCHEGFHRAGRRAGRKRIFIYGAGHTGTTLLGEIRSNPKLPYDVVGFIDDDPAKLHASLQMAPVLGTGADLPRLAELHGINQILAAIPSASPADRVRVREWAQFAGKPCLFVPSWAELLLARPPAADDRPSIDRPAGPLVRR